MVLPSMAVLHGQIWSNEKYQNNTRITKNTSETPIPCWNCSCWGHGEGMIPSGTPPWPCHSSEGKPPPKRSLQQRWEGPVPQVSLEKADFFHFVNFLFFIKWTSPSHPAHPVKMEALAGGGFADKWLLPQGENLHPNTDPAAAPGGDLTPVMASMALPVSPGLRQPLHGALNQTHSPELPKGLPSLPTASRGFSCPFSETGPRSFGRGWQRAVLACRASPPWTAAQSSGKPSLENTEPDLAGGGSWSGMAVQRKVRYWLLQGAFPPHVSVSLSHYKITYQGSPKHTSFLDVNSIPSCPRMVPRMEHVSVRNWGKHFGLIVSFHGAASLAAAPRSSAVLANRGFTLRAAFISAYTWNGSWRADRETKPPNPTSTKTNPSTFSPKMFNTPRGTDFVWNDC